MSEMAAAAGLVALVAGVVARAAAVPVGSGTLALEADALCMMQFDVAVQDERVAAGASVEEPLAAAGNWSEMVPRARSGAQQSLRLLANHLRSEVAHMASLKLHITPQFGVPVVPLAGMIFLVVAYAVMRSCTVRRGPAILKDDSLRRRPAGLEAVKRTSQTSLERQVGGATMPHPAAAKMQAAARAAESADRTPLLRRPWWRCACRRRPDS